MTEIIIGTRNAGKIREMTELLADLPIRLRSLDEFPRIYEPAETGATFLENAVLKAEFYARQTGAAALADDSGLEVEALGGAPGVLSARYAGEGADDAARTAKLLAEMSRQPNANRRARFVCAMALAEANGALKFTATGVCTGSIAAEPRGKHGFGYDPVFIPDGFEQTFGELPDEIKRRLSHRARATGKIIEYLRGFYAEAV